MIILVQGTLALLQSVVTLYGKTLAFDESVFAKPLWPEDIIRSPLNLKASCVTSWLFNFKKVKRKFPHITS